MKRLPHLALLTFAACATAPPPVSAGPTAGFGQVAAVESLRVRPIALLEDSRCPALVRCVWAGQVRISAQILRSSSRETREMTLGKPITVGGGTLTLIDVQPPKAAPGNIDRRAYRFSFRFERVH